ILALASIAAHTIKVDLPLSTSASTISTGYAVGFTSLLLFGLGPTVLMMVPGAWAQCTLNTKQKNPWYRTAFSISTLTLSMFAAAPAARGVASPLPGPADIVVPAIVLSALVYFVVNSTLMAIAIGLSSKRSPLEIWDREFIWGAPNYFLGALVATVAVQG